MKTKDQILSMFFAKLAEYNHLKNKCEHIPLSELPQRDVILMNKLSIEIELLVSILDEDIPEEYWDQIENL